MGRETEEHCRLNLRRKTWLRWGPYLTERQWGTVREDYSIDGNAWHYTSHDASRSTAYRWGEDGIAGISDDQQTLCLAVALWNEKDAMLKERLFGLTGPQGNHGEDVKEIYYYLDSTPTHSYMKMLYKYPHAKFPYSELVEENHDRSKSLPEYELMDTGVFAEDRYFDVFVEYAKSEPEDIVLRITVKNRGPIKAPLHLIPQLWFRNTWTPCTHPVKPKMSLVKPGHVQAESDIIGTFHLYAPENAEFLFTENVTNGERLFGFPRDGYYKDGINDRIVDGDKKAVNPNQVGTKVGVHLKYMIPSGGTQTLEVRLSSRPWEKPFEDTNAIVKARRAEADEFYDSVQEGVEDEDARRIQRQALSGMLWNKQFYYYDIQLWLKGDPCHPAPPKERLTGRNHQWKHIANHDVISMPDKWEYPWYAAWDLAFHTLPLAMVDAKFAKSQLLLLTRDWYMHPDGQLPAYEWAFSDVNPPVHAWAAWRVYKIDKKMNDGRGDRKFLERIFQKLLLNFSWWVNRKDHDGNNVFQGGFLGLDNISVFDRSGDLPTGGYLEQADGTSWMAMYCLTMLKMSLELAESNSVYEDMASKFFEHFLYIANAMAGFGDSEDGLWDDEDEFFYDVLRTEGGHHRMKVRSLVGLIPLFAVETLEPQKLERYPHFKRRLEWFLESRPELASLVSRWEEPGVGERRLLALLRGHRIKRVLKRMLDETEFLSPYGVRALSRYHLDHPYIFEANGQEFRVQYQPAESDSEFFGGNSNWRGPIWFPVNYLIVESLQKFHHYFGDDFKVECPTGSGTFLTLSQIADELSDRLTRLFFKDKDGKRPVYGHCSKMATDPEFRDHILFYEYFDGDNGRGVGASHQTGWTGLVARLLRPRHMP